MFEHVQVQIKHVMWQTSFAWMSFQTWIRAMEFSYVYFWSDATLLTLTWQLCLWIDANDLWMWLAFQRLSPICCFSLYWLGWIFRKPCHGAFCSKKHHRQQQHPMPSDAVAMKATASFIREKIIQDAWKMFGHVQVQIKHVMWQTSFAWMSFQTWIRAMEFSHVYFWSDATLLTLTWQFSLWIIASGLCMWLAIDWVGYFENLAMVLFADLHWRTCVLLHKKHRQQRHPIPFDAVAMKATASIIREKIVQDAWKCLGIFKSESSTFDKHLLHECPFKLEYGHWNSAMPPFWLSLSNSVRGLL